MKLVASPVKAFAREHGIPVVQPRGLRLDGKHAGDAGDAEAALGAAAPEAIVVAAYGLILPPWLLALPRRGCLNIHASLLPRWRGAAPIQRAIEAGDDVTGVTIMQMDAGLDTGPMLLADAVEIGADDSAGNAPRPARRARRRADRARARRARRGAARRQAAARDRRHLRREDRPRAKRRSTGAPRRRRSSGACAPSIRRPGARSALAGEAITLLARRRPRRAAARPGEVVAVERRRARRRLRRRPPRAHRAAARRRPAPAGRGVPARLAAAAWRRLRAAVGSGRRRPD